MILMFEKESIEYIANLNQIKYNSLGIQQFLILNNIKLYINSCILSSMNYLYEVLEKFIYRYCVNHAYCVFALYF